VPPPIQTYYDGSPEEDQDLLELRKAHYDRLHALRLQAARFGDAVPANIAAGIADAESQINAIDEVRKAKIRPETAERLGATGQFTVLAGRLDLVSQQLRQQQQEAEDWRTKLAGGLASLAEHHADFQRTTRMIFQAIGAILFILALALIGIGAALWTLR